MQIDRKPWLKAAAFLLLAPFTVCCLAAHSQGSRGKVERNSGANSQARSGVGSRTATLLELARDEAADGHVDEANSIYKRVSNAMPGGPDAVGQLDILPDWARMMAGHNRYKEAQALYCRAIEIAQKQLSSKDVRIPRLVNKLAQLQYDHREFENASASFKTALALNDKVKPKSHGCLTTSMVGVANTAFQRGNFTEANLYYEKVIDETEAAHRPKDRVCAKSLLGMANILTMQSKYAEAIPLYKQALAIFQSIKPAPLSSIANVLQNMANLYVLASEYPQAEKLYKESISTAEKSPNLVWLVDTAQRNFVQLYVLQNKYPEVENLYRQILAREESTKTHTESVVIGDTVGLADACASQGKTVEARALYEGILKMPKGALDETKAAIFEKIAKACAAQRNNAESESFYKQANQIYTKISDTGGCTRTLLGLGALYDEQQDHLQALLTYEKAFALCPKDFSNPSPSTEKIASHLATTFLTLKRAEGVANNGQPIKFAEGEDQAIVMTLPKLLHESGANNYNKGRYVEAAYLFQQAADIQSLLKGADDPDTVQNLVGSANAEYLRGHFAEAEKRYQQAMVSCERSRGSDSSEVANLLTGMACIYAEQKKYKEAERMYSRASRIYRQTTGWESADQARCLHGLASLYYDQRQFDDAEPLFKKTISIRERVLGDRHPALASSLDGLAHLYDKKGDYRQAEILYKRSLSILQSRLDPNHPMLAENMSNLADVYRKQGRYIDAEPLYKFAMKTYEKNGEYDRSDFAACVTGYTALLQDTNRLNEATEIASKARVMLSQGRSRAI